MQLNAEKDRQSKNRKSQNTSNRGTESHACVPKRLESMRGCLQIEKSTLFTQGHYGLGDSRVAEAEGILRTVVNTDTGLLLE